MQRGRISPPRRGCRRPRATDRCLARPPADTRLPPPPRLLRLLRQDKMVHWLLFVNMALVALMLFVDLAARCVRSVFD